MLGVSPEAAMAVPVDVRQKRIAFEEFADGTAPDGGFPNTGVQDTQGGTVGNENCLGIHEFGQSSQIGLNFPFRLLKRATHKWQGILVADEGESPARSPAGVD